MTLEQTTLFGVRGERFRIKKNAPISVAPVRAETLLWKCLDCGHKWRDLAECKAVCPGGCPGCGSLRIMDCNLGSAGERGTFNAQRPTLNAQGGETTGCGLLILLALAAGCFAAAWLVERRGVRGEWLAEYPDPVCERCGKVLDGMSKECLEEGN